MDWNGCWSVNTVTPFLFESTGDSEEVKSPVHHDQEQDEAVMNDSKGLWFRFDDPNDVDVEEDEDDAQSCSYDHSSYINTRLYDDSQHDQSQRLTYDDHEDSNIDYDDDDDYNDNENNQGESKLMDSSKQEQKRSHKFCVDLLNQREIDRKFWEACLAS